MTRLFLCVLVTLCLLPAQTVAQQAVTLQLQWTHAFQFAGYYAAREKGFYAEAGLEVTIREAEQDVSVAEIVTRGDAHYGVSSSSLLLERARGLPVVALASTHQHSPYVLVVPLDSPAQTIAGLAGLRVMLESGAEELRALLRREGVHDDIEFVPHSFDPQDLVDGQVDAYSAYSTNELFYFRERGFNTLTYSPQSAGIDFYGDTLFTSESELRKHPERVAAFREASLRGWQYALAHPEEMVELIVERYPSTMSAEHLRFEATEQARLMDPGEVPLGHMSAERWRHIAGVYAELGMLPTGADLDDGFLYDPTPVRSSAPPAASRMTWIAAGALLLALLALLAMMQTRRRLTQARVQLEAGEIELAESRRQFDLLAEHVEDVVWTLDVTDRRFTWVSPSVSRQRGIDPEQVLSSQLDAAIVPEQLEQVERCLDEAPARLRAGDTEGRCTLDQPCADGSTIRVHIRYRLSVNELTARLEMTGTSRSIEGN
ncbi:MAG: ABC transporter substrate-binding protein [Azoarcus sp.]|nr:ABC transporter substrate-binding protein [Azoarcus sp.]